MKEYLIQKYEGYIENLKSEMEIDDSNSGYNYLKGKHDLALEILTDLKML